MLVELIRVKAKLEDFKKVATKHFEKLPRKNIFFVGVWSLAFVNDLITGMTPIVSMMALGFSIFELDKKITNMFIKK